MNRVRFLADANLHQDIVLGARRRAPDLIFDLPQVHIPDGTPDLTVLRIAAGLGAVLVTHDLRTMPHHFAEFVSSNESPGLIIIPSRTLISAAIEDLVTIWTASLANEWINQYRILPL